MVAKERRQRQLLARAVSKMLHRKLLAAVNMWRGSLTASRHAHMRIQGAQLASDLQAAQDAVEAHKVALVGVEQAALQKGSEQARTQIKNEVWDLMSEEGVNVVHSFLLSQLEISPSEVHEAKGVLHPSPSSRADETVRTSRGQAVNKDLRTKRSSTVLVDQKAGGLTLEEEIAARKALRNRRQRGHAAGSGGYGPDHDVHGQASVKPESSLQNMRHMVRTASYASLRSHSLGGDTSDSDCADEL